MAQIFLFDGDCAFCSSSMRLLNRMTRERISSKPYQFADLTALNLTLEQVQSAVYYVSGPKQFRGAVAIAHFLMDSKTVWAVAGWLMRAPVIISFAELIYSAIAANRHRLPGGKPECELNPKS